MLINKYSDKDITIDIYQFELIDERMYILKLQDEAVVIDPYIERDLLDDIKDVKKLHILLTHEHFDHISGVNWFRENFICDVFASETCAKMLASPDNETSRFPLLFIGDKNKYHYVKRNYVFPYTCKADITFSGSYCIEWKGHRFEMIETPGHTKGCISILVDSRYLFAGDNLLGNGYELKSIDSDLILYKSSFDYYLTMKSKNILVFPGHGEAAPIEKFIKRIEDSRLWN